MNKIIFSALALVAISTATEASARPRLSQDERVAYGQMHATEVNDQLLQHKVDRARAFCERNGGRFDMNQVRYTDDTNTRRRVRSEDRGAIYRRGRATVIDPVQMVFGALRPKVDIDSDYRADVRISDNACVYPRVER